MTVGIDRSSAELLAAGLRELFADPGLDLDASLDELGWDEVVAADPAVATTVLFTEQGHALPRFSALDRTVRTALEPLLPPAAGRRGILLPGLSPAGAATDPAVVTGLLTSDPAGLREVVIAFPNGTGSGLAVVAIEDLTVARAVRFDPGCGFREVVARTPAPLDINPVVAARAWTSAVAAGRRALAVELNAVSEAIMRITVEHVSNRCQFGGPISAYQTVRHRLADAHAGIEAARCSAASALADGGSCPAAVAKALAGSANRTVARHATQLCGAIGVTAEHRLPRYVARGRILDAVLGSTRELETEIGAQVLRGVRLPQPDLSAAADA